MAFDPNNPAGTGMVMTFDDEFSTLSASAGGSSDGKLWANHLWYNGGAGDAANVPSALSVSNGVLNITSTNTGNGWTSGTLQSTNSAGQGFAQKYGYFEVTAKVPNATGIISTFYLMSNDHVKDGSKPATEFDILETKDSTPTDTYTTLHLDSSHGADQQNMPLTHVGVDTSQAFHTYGLLWAPNSDHITFYFDGKPIMDVPKYANTDSAPAMMILQNIVGTWGGSPDGSTPSTATMQVDSVRVWQFADQSPTALVSNGVVATPTPSPTPTPTPIPTPTPAGSDTITLHVSGDQYQGNPQFQVLVDGHQVGSSTYNVTAVHSSGQWQDITLTGNFASAHTVDVKFTNDAYAGSANLDRNLYVQSMTFDGHQYAGTSASNNASGGASNYDPSAAVMVINGTTEFTLSGATPTPTPTPTPASSDTLKLHLSGDQWQGNDQFTVSIDGHQVGGVYEVSAAHSAGQWQDVSLTGNFAGAHQVAVNFINDGYGGSLSTDRNLYIGSITLDGHSFAGTSGSDNASGGLSNLDPNAAVMVINGATTFDVTGATPAATPVASGAAITPAATTGTGSSTPPTPQSHPDGAGHDVFVFNTPADEGGTIANFQSGTDILDVTNLLKSVGYTGQDPLADHVLTVVQSGTDSSKVMIDPTGQDPNHGASLVTLSHVLPQNVHATDIWH
jgi:beta-glucanase (GH16 family)